ncbi:alpha/beta fold hydrolase [Sphingomonas floccifaciens]|uniref:Alpha/beta fold hydrolase n=1 Tax=Sphingomonas floccifaciens TaxID=1844115 RepID=A0ABW4NCA1_9SPHN
MHQITRGIGKPLLLIHGLGSSWHAWQPILHDLAVERSVIAIDLPGHGATPARSDSGTFEGLVASVERYLVANDLVGIDAVGSSMGARIALELARRGKVGNVVALDPGGFWRGWERGFFRTTIGLSARLLRVLRSRLPAISRSAAARAVLLAQLSARPSALSAELVCTELTGITDTPTFDALVNDLANGPEQTGPAADPTCRIVIGWGRQDRLCLPRQAARALSAFPSATLHWFDECGHFPVWDVPREATSLILKATR